MYSSSIAVWAPQNRAWNYRLDPPFQRLGDFRLTGETISATDTEKDVLRFDLPWQRTGAMDLTQVNVEGKGCKEYGMLGWASDNWQETGVFHVMRHLLVHLDVYYNVRSAVQAGNAVRTALQQDIKPRLEDLEWLNEN